MSATTGLPGIWEDIRNYLVVSTEVIEEGAIKNDVPLNNKVRCHEYSSTTR